MASPKPALLHRTQAFFFLLPPEAMTCCRFTYLIIDKQPAKPV
jgi:hypothetical protein